MQVVPAPAAAEEEEVVVVITVQAPAVALVYLVQERMVPEAAEAEVQEEERADLEVLTAEMVTVLLVSHVVEMVAHTAVAAVALYLKIAVLLEVLVVPVQ